MEQRINSVKEIKEAKKRRDDMAKVGVLGAGSWGTALAILLHDNGHDVTV